MSQQAPKVAQSVAQRFFNNLKSREFRDYLMRYDCECKFIQLLCKTNLV